MTGKKLQKMILLLIGFIILMYLVFSLYLYREDYRNTRKWIDRSLNNITNDINRSLWSYEIDDIKEKINFLEKYDVVKKVFVYEKIEKKYITENSNIYNRDFLKEYKNKFFYSIEKRELKYNGESIGRLIVVVNKYPILLDVFKFILALSIILFFSIWALKSLIRRIKSSFEEQLSKNKKLKTHYYNVIQSSPNPLIILNSDNTIFASNNSFKNEFLNKAGIFFKSEAFKQIKNYLYNIQDIKDDIFLQNVTIYNKNYSVYIYPEHSIEEKSKKVIIQYVDITEIKEIEKKYIRAQKMETVGMLTGGVAHDFNNLLAGLFSYTDIIKKNLEKEDDLKNLKYIKEIKNILVQGKELVNQILIFSRETNLEREMVNVNDALNTSIAIAKHSIAKEINIIINNSLNEKVYVYANKNILIQIFLNLLINAGDALEEQEDPFIKIVLKCNDNKLFFTIKDNGVGIPQQNIDKIFDPFFTTKKGNSTKKGTGLGLSIVYEKISSIDGVIDLKSQEGKGTTFKIILPCFKKKKESDSTIGDKSLDKLKNLNLLIVEDEKLIARSLKELLEDSYGINSKIVFNGNEAYNYLKSNEVDLIFLDWIMPEMNGKEFIIEINKNEKNPPPVLLTSGSFEKNMKDIVKDYSFIKDILYKPYNIETLISKISSNI